MHLSAIRGRVPFLNFFDGFRTSHEIQKVELLDYDDLKKLVDQDALARFRRESMNPDTPVIRGTAQNPDIYFQTREAVNQFYEALPEVLMVHEGNQQTHRRDYQLFNYTGAPDAERVIILMGSGAQTAEEVVKILAGQGEKVGVLNVHLYRPFSVKHFLSALPETVKKIAVLDRTKEPGSDGEPLYLDVRNAFYESDRRPVIVGGRYGMGSKEFYPGDVLAVFDNLKLDAPKNHFTVGIVDDVTHTSLKKEKSLDITPKYAQLPFLGPWERRHGRRQQECHQNHWRQDGHVCPGYFAYDSKKSGGITISHLRFGHDPIHMPFLINFADYIAVHNPSYVRLYNVLNGIKEGGTFLLNCGWSGEELDTRLPGQLKRVIAEKKVNFYTIDAVKIAREIGLGGRINMIMQAAFFKLADIIPIDDAVAYLKESIEHTYGKKGQDVVDMNGRAVEAGVKNLVKVTVPEAWKDCTDEELYPKTGNAFVDQIMMPMNQQEGNTFPSGSSWISQRYVPSGTTKYEKRGHCCHGTGMAD